MNAPELTAAQYKALTGADPMDDDMDRVNCKAVGTVGHRQCGWCREHGRPRFMCGCRAALAATGAK